MAPMRLQRHRSGSTQSGVARTRLTDVHRYRIHRNLSAIPFNKIKDLNNNTRVRAGYVGRQHIWVTSRTGLWPAGYDHNDRGPNNRVCGGSEPRGLLYMVCAMRNYAMCIWLVQGPQLHYGHLREASLFLEDLLTDRAIPHTVHGGGARELTRKLQPLAVNSVVFLDPLRSVQFSSVQFRFTSFSSVHHTTPSAVHLALIPCHTIAYERKSCCTHYVLQFSLVQFSSVQVKY